MERGHSLAGTKPARFMEVDAQVATITTRVKTVLLNDPQVAATKIDVSTAGGIVTLSGTVQSKADETRAIERCLAVLLMLLQTAR